MEPQWEGGCGWNSSRGKTVPQETGQRRNESMWHQAGIAFQALKGLRTIGVMESFEDPVDTACPGTE